MTTPIAGFVRALPEVAPASHESHAASASPAHEHGETFGSALATALADEKAATPRAVRPRREPNAARQASSRGEAQSARAARGERTAVSTQHAAHDATETPDATIARDADVRGPDEDVSPDAGAAQGDDAARGSGRALGITEGVARGIEHASSRAKLQLAKLFDVADRESAASTRLAATIIDGQLPTEGNPAIANVVPLLSTPAGEPAAAKTPVAGAPSAERPSVEGGVLSRVVVQPDATVTLLDAVFGTPAATSGDVERQETDEELPADTSLAERFVEGAIPAPAAIIPEAGVTAPASAAAAATAVAAAPVAPSAATTPNAAAVSPETTVRSSTAALVPDLRLRLERVIDRMKSEFGYDVQVVETVRSQARQDDLFAQGRTAPGPVVTWTRNSKHIVGRAVDVIIDGSYGNDAAYRDLAAVAEQEGLKSLWPRDGGHLELPGAVARGQALPEVARDATARIPSPIRAGVDPRSVMGTERSASERSVFARSATTAPTETPAGTPIERTAAREAMPQWAPTAVPQEARAPEAPRIPVLPQIPSSKADVVLPRIAAAGESPVPQRTAGMARVASIAHVADVARVAQVAPVSTVDQVAQVARVANAAQVAQVAQVATVPSTGDDTPITEKGPATRLPLGGARPRSTALAPAGAAAATPAVVTQDPDAARSDRREPGSRRERDRATALLSALDARGGRDDQSLARTLLGGDNTSISSSGLTDRAESVAGLSRTDATERIARVLKMQESAGDRPLSSVLLRLDAPDGSEDRIRIGLRGTSVEASFDVSDPKAADNLRLHARELQDALQRQGLEGDSMVVRTTQNSVKRTSEPGTLASAVAAEREGVRVGSTAASDGGGSTAKDSRNQPRADDWREGASQHRSRQQRQNGKENR